MRVKHLIAGGASALILTGLMAGAALAQDRPAAPDPDQPVTTVDALIVSPQKREQRLQDVPIVDNVAGAQLLKDADVSDIRDLAILTPGLTVTATQNESLVTARIRGVGTVGDNPGLESSVGVTIDGVYRPRDGVGFGDLGDLDRIEVLKGPQGTLFGKNTSAGVINIFTKEPSFQPVFEGEVTSGNYNALGASANMSGTISGDSLAGSLYLAGRKRDGFLNVVTLGADRPSTDNNQAFFTSRGQLLFLPNNKLAVRIIADHTVRNESCCGATQLFVGTQQGGAPYLPGNPLRSRARGELINDLVPGSIDLTSTPFDRTAYLNRRNDQNILDDGLSAQVDYDFGMAKLTSISAVRSWDQKGGQDTDFTAADILYRPTDGTNFTGFRQMSQELRLAGEKDKLNWLVGAFVAREDLNTGNDLLFGSDYFNYLAVKVLNGAPLALGMNSGNTFQSGNGQRDQHGQDDNTYAFFTNNDYAFSDQLTGTLGLRFTSDRKSVVSQFHTTGGSCQNAGLTSAPTLNAFQANPGLGTTQAQRTAAVTSAVAALCLGFENPAFDALGKLHQSGSDDNLSGTAKLAWRANKDIMTYASYSRGFKAGGFNLDRETRVIGYVPGTALPANLDGSPAIPGIPIFAPDPNTAFAPEKVDSYELGAKTQWLNSHLSFNVAAFDQKFTDFQLNTFIGTQFIVETLPTVTSKGVDLDFMYLPPMTGLTIQGGATFADTRIGQFTAADLTDPSHFANLSNLPGQRLAFAPRTSVTLAATWETPMSNGMKFRANISGKYNSEFNTGSDLHPSKDQPAFTLVNARMGIGPANDKWTLEVWADNLFNTDYLQVGFNGPLQVASGPQSVSDPQSVYDAFLGAPRTYGLTLRAKLK